MAKIVVQSNFAIESSRLTFPQYVIEESAYVLESHIVIESKFFCNYLKPVAAYKGKSSPHSQIDLEELFFGERRFILGHIDSHSRDRHKSVNETDCMYWFIRNAKIVAYHFLANTAFFIGRGAVKMRYAF